MDLSEEHLMAYADGEADPKVRAAIEAAMAVDSSVRERVEAHRRLRGAIAGAFGGALTEPVPERLMAAARGEPAGPRPARPAEIVDLAAVRARKVAPKAAPAPRPAWVQWSALAACLAIGVILARGLGGIGTSPMIADHHGTLMADGALSAALNQQVAGSQAAPDQAVKIGVSFHSNEKLLCRTFQVVRGDGLAGLACRAPGGWQVRVAAAAPAHGVAASGYRTAASTLPAAVSATVDALIVGSPLDAQAEAAAKAKGWRE
jgi:anti-sigma factor RsiW